MNSFTNGLMSGWICSMLSMMFAVWIQINYIDKDKGMTVTPIVLQCPNETKQIVITPIDAQRLGL